MIRNLSVKGYSLYKDDIQNLEELKQELTVKPYLPEGYGVAAAKSFKIYQEGPNKIYLPKAFGLAKFGAPTSVRYNTAQTININFQGGLRKEQEEPVAHFLAACKDPLKMGGLLNLPCGFGKCLGYDTDIIMYDGQIKKVQDIRVGDVIMGDDGGPRNVLSLARGKERLYEVQQTYGDSYIVNESHILSLRDITGTVVDIGVLDFLKGNHKHLFGYKVGIQLVDRETPIDEYLMGVHLGTYKKPIPHVYKYNSVKRRSKLLEGIVDVLGNMFLIKEDYCEFERDVLYVARSLGYVAKIDSGFIHIEKNKPLVTPITVRAKGIDKYYGFEIDGNKRFLLGDFTVTHNTTISIYIIQQLAVKTLIIVHKDFLLQQWKERIEQFAPNAKLGYIKAKQLEVDNCDIVIGSLQSISMKSYDEKVFDGFGLVIVDECHHMGAEIFSQAFKKITFQYTLGLSATVKRKDGLSKVFQWYLGDIVYKISKRVDTVDVMIASYTENHPDYSKEWVMYNNKPNISKMINNICSYMPRIDFIKNIIVKVSQDEPERKYLILSDRRGHLNTLKIYLENSGIGCGLYYGGLKPEILKQSEKQQVILATFQYASEGFDLGGLDTLILASPKSDIVQSVGRILRDKPECRKHIPLIIDIVDDFSLFPAQAKKRLQYYKQCKYTIKDDKVAM